MKAVNIESQSTNRGQATQIARETKREEGNVVSPRADACTLKVQASTMVEVSKVVEETIRRRERLQGAYQGCA